MRCDRVRKGVKKRDAEDCCTVWTPSTSQQGGLMLYKGGPSTLDLNIINTEPKQRRSPGLTK